MWSPDGRRNLFSESAGELGLSESGYHFIGGLLQHSESMAAITNATVNSYKRINAPPTLSGATWSPSSITFGGNNRTHMIRIPDAGRIEHRLPDNSANPYLLMAGILAAGLDGIDNRTSSGKRLDINMYTESHLAEDVKKLPLNLLDAIRRFDENEKLKSALGDELSQAYINMKTSEWNRYSQSISAWERENTLDC
jgi:glutamine synthetase